MDKIVRNRILIGVGVGLFIVAMLMGIWEYYRLNISNLQSIDEKEHAYYIEPDMSLDSVLSMVGRDYVISSKWALRRHIERMKLQAPQTGFYRFPSKMGDKYLVRRLLLGEQDPIRLTFTNNVRTAAQLAKRLSSKLLLDSAAIHSRLVDEAYMGQFGLNKETALCLFIPNTYEVYWTITADQLFARMHHEYRKFWNDSRLHKADSLGLTPIEVVTLASIVEGETHNKQEIPIVASLYMNRLRKGMLLQSCPTVIYATGNLGLRRVLNRHLATDSPYNTYKYKGLPPGPIRCPLPSTIDLVLSAPKTDYIYMCANADFSGTHIFSSNYRQHAAAAVRYRRALDKRHIR